jgi:hypothetical protein
MQINWQLVSWIRSGSDPAFQETRIRSYLFKFTFLLKKL